MVDKHEQREHVLPVASNLMFHKILSQEVTSKLSLSSIHAASLSYPTQNILVLSSGVRLRSVLDVAGVKDGMDDSFGNCSISVLRYENFQYLML